MDDLKGLRKILGKLKESPKSVIFRKLSEDPYSEDLKVLTYSDAGHTKREEKSTSINGRITYVVNKRTGMCNPIEWKTKRLTRVYRSVKTSEAISAEENAGQGANLGTIIREIMTGKKKHEQKEDSKKDSSQSGKLAGVELFIDNESTYCNIYSDKNPKEQSLIYDIRRIQQLLRDKELGRVHLVETKAMLADQFTKEMKPSVEFKQALYDGFLVPQCRCCYKPRNNLPCSGFVDFDPGFETGAETQTSGKENEEEANQ